MNIREIPSIHAGEVLLEEFLKPNGVGPEHGGGSEAAYEL